MWEAIVAGLIYRTDELCDLTLELQDDIDLMLEEECLDVDFDLCCEGMF